MWWIDLVKAFAVGICASAPIGPVLIYVLQKSVNNGMMPAFVAGLGAAVVDTLYALISLAALSFVTDFLNHHEALIMMVGGMVVAAVGLRMVLKQPQRTVNAAGELVRESPKVTDFFKVLGMSLANPGALALMLAVVALFRLDFYSSPSPAWMLVLCVFAGGVVFWFSFSSVAGLFRKSFRERRLKWLNIVTGVAVVVFGVVLVAKGILIVV